MFFLISFFLVDRSIARMAFFTASPASLLLSLMALAADFNPDLRMIFRAVFRRWRTRDWRRDFHEAFLMGITI